MNPRHRDYPCTAFPVPHLRPLGHPSACSPEQPSRVLRPNVERRSPATAVAARPSSRGALRTLAGCPPDRRAPEPCAGAPTPIQLAEGRGFEPPRDLRPYPISSRTPSTGLGHPSAWSTHDFARVVRSYTAPRPLPPAPSCTVPRYPIEAGRVHPRHRAPLQRHVTRVAVTLSCFPNVPPTARAHRTERATRRRSGAARCWASSMPAQAWRP